MRWLLLVVFVLLAAPYSATANPKIADLEQKVADLSLLQHQLVDRIEQAKALREKFLRLKESYTDEIATLRQRFDINNFEDADRNLRIHYNIQLIGSLTACLDQIEHKIIFLQTGLDKLSYLQQSAKDDIKMIGALNDLEIDALTTQISLIINQYIGDAHVIQLDSENIDSFSPLTIWKAIVASK